MDAYERVEKVLRDGMHEGNMHVCLRDAGRLAGGLRAGGSLKSHEVASLKDLAVSLSKSKQEATVKWDEAVEFGTREPLHDEPRRREIRKFGFDDEIAIGPAKQAAPAPEPAPVLVDENYIAEDEELPPPAPDWEKGDIIRYLETMFEPDECVGIVTTAKEEGGKHRPGGKGFYSQTRGDLIDAIQKASDISDVIGTPDPKAGVWVRINPLDGKDCKDLNVTAFRHTLIEADSGDLGGQLARIREMQLPCTCIVHSGGKSIHALVRVDAPDMVTYRARVDRLYEVCEANGLKVDSANRNPSRLSRLPGVWRNGQKQYIIAGKSGKESWAAWEKHLEEASDDLPDPVQLAHIWEVMPPLAPELIPGVLRAGHKMRLTGPSKGGKSFGLQALTCALAEGKPWWGWPVKQGRVLYINLEVDAASCFHRFQAIYNALGWRPETICDIDVWNLRGKAVPLIKLAPKLIRRAAGRHYKAIIFDPIYKLSWGDENDAGDVALFCNQLDAICHELNCAVIDAHHHSKGAQGAKKSIDRGSGSGVFGRDPDAILDMVELDVTGKRREELEKACWHDAVNLYAAGEMLDMTVLDGKAWGSVEAFGMEVAEHFPLQAADFGEVIKKASDRARRLTGWRVEGTLREFATPDPLRIWFEHPCHFPDAWGLLTDAKASGEAPPWEEERQAKEDAREAKAAKIRANFDAGLEACGGPGKATVEAMAISLGVSQDTIRRLAKQYGFSRHKGLIFRETDDEADTETGATE